MSHDRTLAEPQFPGDDGLVDPRLEAAFGDDAAVFEVLPEVRVFVPIVPILGESTPTGGDKNADMAAVLMTGADGRTALLAFSSTSTMTHWSADARPVPVLGSGAAQAALDEGASAILLDLGSPTFTVVELTARQDRPSS
ncbi:SseB family protein [Aeromicrobium sp. CF3.5]|uniref:SseB family protein n=1 Tax=Aeromicrobium sp. CF3.5 TaxID=3373078 RepID=UPI003EE46137